MCSGSDRDSCWCKAMKYVNESSSIDGRLKNAAKQMISLGVVLAIIFSCGLRAGEPRNTGAMNRQVIAAINADVAVHHSRFMRINEYLFNGKEGKTAVA